MNISQLPSGCERSALECCPELNPSSWPVSFCFTVFPFFFFHPQDYQAIVDAEWNILYDKLEKIYKSGAKVVLSKLPIGDVATQYFADRDLFCAGRVQEEDLRRTMMVR